MDRENKAVYSFKQFDSNRFELFQFSNKESLKLVITYKRFKYSNFKNISTDFDLLNMEKFSKKVDARL